jgi:hypothetical protein
MTSSKTQFLLLILTNPYAYETAVDKALAQAQQTHSPLKVVFAIDPEDLDTLMRDLGESGWLGIGSRRSLQESMLGGYRALAADILESVESQCAEAGIPVETQVEEVRLQPYLQSWIDRGVEKIMVNGSHSLTPIMEKMSPSVEWIPEE